MTVDVRGRPRIGILCDFAEEQWPSMNLVADMLTQHLQCDHSSILKVIKIRPPFMRRFSRLSATGALALNADRLLNRMFDYPRYLRTIIRDFDLFHVIDHSYSHLLHHLPQRCAVVTCHDLGTFRCLLHPESEPRSSAYRIMARQILAGLKRAASISCVSESTRTELLQERLAEAQQTVVIQNGVAPVFSPAPEPEGDRAAALLLGSTAGTIDLLNVGSIAPRKRIDILLQVVALARRRYPDLRLVRVGGHLNARQSELAEALGIRRAIVELPFLSSDVLAAVYRRAALVLCPSEAEGFGLPLLEGIACGTPVVASDVEAMREVGGPAAEYARVGDVRQWTEILISRLGAIYKDSELSAREREVRVGRAKDFSWHKAAAHTVEIYRDLLN